MTPEELAWAKEYAVMFRYPLDGFVKAVERRMKEGFSFHQAATDVGGLLGIGPRPESIAATEAMQERLNRNAGRPLGSSSFRNIC